MTNKQHLIDSISRSNIAYAEKVELIELIKNSRDNDDAIVKTIINYFNIGEKFISLFYDSPSDFINDVKDFLNNLSNY